MPLPLPDLDTRRWVDLVDEARALIPRYAPGWTDHNLHDPGITLIELLGWLVELDVYRLNRVPEAHKRKFLALAGFSPTPPRAARAVAAFLTPQSSRHIGTTGVELTANPPDGGTVRFSTIEALDLVPAVLTTVQVETVSGGPRQTISAYQRAQGPFATLGDDPVAGAALWLGFDAPLPIGETVRLALSFAGGRSGIDERQRILDEAAAVRAACLPVQPAPPSCAELPASPDVRVPELLQHHSVRLAWEYYGASGWTALQPAMEPLKPGQVVDDTRALTLDGGVVIQLDTAMVPYPGDSAYLVRARLVSGDYDTPPLLQDVSLNAVRIEQAPPLSQLFRINVGVVAGGTPPVRPGEDWFSMEPVRLRLQFDAGGAIAALEFSDDADLPQFFAAYYQPATATERGLLQLDLVSLGNGTGLPNQSATLPEAPVQGESLQLYSLEPAGGGPAIPAWRAWQQRPDLDASGGSDAHVVLDETSGQVSFGDGNRGRIPPSGVPLLAAYRTTAADAGNVAAAEIDALAPSLRNWLQFDPIGFHAFATSAGGLDQVVAAQADQAWSQLNAAGFTTAKNAAGAVANPLAAAGGAATETVTHAAGRAVQTLQQPTRAVTAADFETLAPETPGTVIARVRALPGHHPSFPCLMAPGVVTVIVVPDQHGGQPTPSDGLIALVRRYLNRRRILGTHFEVVGPGYVVVQVTAQVKLLPGFAASPVQSSVSAALDAFLNPLTGGPAVIPAASSAGTTAALPAPPPATPALGPGVTLISASAPQPPSPIAPSPPPPPGWPFGRDVYVAEVLQVIAGVAGVDNVVSLSLSADGNPAQCGNLCVGPTVLVVSGMHTIEAVP
jgi:hypothetical protein